MTKATLLICGSATPLALHPGRPACSFLPHARIPVLFAREQTRSGHTGMLSVKGVLTSVVRRVKVERDDERDDGDGRVRHGSRRVRPERAQSPLAGTPPGRG